MTTTEHRTLLHNMEVQIAPKESQRAGMSPSQTRLDALDPPNSIDRPHMKTNMLIDVAHNPNEE